MRVQVSPQHNIELDPAFMTPDTGRRHASGAFLCLGAQLVFARL
jgi:hypothetical protein